jgi:hypothetical protein
LAREELFYALVAVGPTRYNLQALRQIKFEAPLRFVSKFISHIRCDLATQFTLEWEYARFEEEQLDEIASMVEQSFGQALDTLHIEYRSHRTWTGKYLVPFVAQLHLSELDLSIGNAQHGVARVFNFEDGTLEELGRALPSLQKLRLTFEGSINLIPTSPNATFSGLFRLLKHCVHLRELAIPINAVDPPFYKLPTINIPVTKVRRLDVVCSPVDNVFYVAELVSVAFPLLEVLQSDKRKWMYNKIYTEAHTRHWQTIWDMQSTLRRARLDERLKATSSTFRS